mgnify:CR=1 FL=1
MTNAIMMEENLSVNKLEEKSKENDSLKAYAKMQDGKVKNLQQENELLKNKLENLANTITKLNPVVISVIFTIFCIIKLMNVCEP